MEDRLSRGTVPEQAINIARAIVNEADRRVIEHERDLHPEASAIGPVPIRVVAEIVAWLGVQYSDTGLWDVEAAAAKWDMPAAVLWPELARYFQGRANGGWRG